MKEQETTELKRQIDKALKKIRAEIIENQVKVWTSKDCSQEFLRGLIPSRQPGGRR